MSRAQPTMVGPFILGDTIGSGSTSKVKSAVHKDTGTRVAIKILRKEMLTRNPMLRRKVEREIAAMKLLEHPNVLRLYDILQSSRYLFLVLEYVENGELYQYLRKRGKLSAEDAFRFFRELINGVEYLQSRFIAHRDLKLENILLDKDNHVKIADFGMANLMRDGEFLASSCGSPHYASPEVVRGVKYHGLRSDIWSCGVILFALVSGRLPFDDKNIQRLLDKVVLGKVEIPSNIDPLVADLIARMLRVNPEERISVQEMKKHSWWVREEAKLSPEERAFGTDYSDDFEVFPVTEIDEEVFCTIQSLGWKDSDELRTLLRNDEENYEKVVYHLLRTRKERSLVNPLGIEPCLSVSPSNPIYDTPHHVRRPMDAGKEKAGEEGKEGSKEGEEEGEDDDEEGDDEGDEEEEEEAKTASKGEKDALEDEEPHSPGSEPAAPVVVGGSVGVDAGKKTRGRRRTIRSAFGLLSTKPIEEIKAELARALNALRLRFIYVSDLHVKVLGEKGEFHVEIMDSPTGDAYFINGFCVKKGSEENGSSLWLLLQKELHL
eukprot:TRINITY_DN82781_c0_g1_i1.p1 TRINITY_DN82781_c0_g1~~TRINITY_DN82781_c0_g1_i1.p1  ORF type:complete len:548 (-),score=180.22 TRINITY_DN82781_c0_g1_i1:201-1844(-)